MKTKLLWKNAWRKARAMKNLAWELRNSEALKHISNAMWHCDDRTRAEKHERLNYYYLAQGSLMERDSVGYREANLQIEEAGQKGIADHMDELFLPHVDIADNLRRMIQLRQRS